MRTDESGQAVAEYLGILAALLAGLVALNLGVEGNLIERLNTGLSDQLFTVISIIRLPF